MKKSLHVAILALFIGMLLHAETASAALHRSPSGSGTYTSTTLLEINGAVYAPCAGSDEVRYSYVNADSLIEFDCGWSWPFSENFNGSYCSKHADDVAGVVPVTAIKLYCGTNALGIMEGSTTTPAIGAYFYFDDLPSGTSTVINTTSTEVVTESQGTVVFGAFILIYFGFAFFAYSVSGRLK